jgi:Ser/Thr protein kinase RdoA (MazF antagonist)
VELEVKPFRELTRRSRLYRLRELACKAIEAYQLDNAQLKFVQYFENIIYRVDLPGSKALTDDGSPYRPNRYLLRIHAMGDADAIASELTWLAALSQEAGLPVPAPITTPDGKLLTTIITPGMPNGRVVSVMRWLDGRRYGKGLQPKQLSALGQVVARLHNFSAGWQHPKEFTRPVWDWDSQLGGSMFRHPMDKIVDSIPPKFQEPFQVIAREGKQIMGALGKGPEAYGLIHADLYPENVLFKDGKALPIDFEDCGYGYWMWDIAIALCEWAWGKEWERMRDAFWEGYSQVRTLPGSQWAQLDLFIAIQFATMVLWSSALFMNDPKRAAEYIPWREGNGNKLLEYFNR